MKYCAVFLRAIYQYLTNSLFYSISVSDYIIKYIHNILNVYVRIFENKTLATIKYGTLYFK